ncbi:Uma2 family endonuclease [Kitasatospora sp. NPDC049258]|uniref:Uma2 family endonuclease n=1 Tax=Kitasatospora sp. NPDC049258 TaxID=3155394 RepID=UPI003441A1C9
MTSEMVAPAWMHAQVSAEQYDMSPGTSKRHNRLARVLANALDAAAGPDRNADTDFDLRLHDVPLTNRLPDVVVYRADTIDVTPTRPEHALLVVEVVSPGSETTDRVVKTDQYAKAGIPFYWRVEQAATAFTEPVYTYLLDPASRCYREGEVFTGSVKAVVPLAVECELSVL